MHRGRVLALRKHIKSNRDQQKGFGPESRILILADNNPDRRWVQLITPCDFSLIRRTCFVSSNDCCIAVFVLRCNFIQTKALPSVDFAVFCIFKSPLSFSFSFLLVKFHGATCVSNPLASLNCNHQFVIVCKPR
jgi:hypothetical protein